MRIRARFCRGEQLKFLGHLDMMRTFIRAMRRAGIPMEYSRGFNPQPHLAFAAPLPVGVTSVADLFDLFLRRPLQNTEFCSLLNDNLPTGLQVLEAASVSKDAPSLMSLVEAALYRILWTGNVFKEEPSTRVKNAFTEGIDALLRESELVVQRKGKKGIKKVNIRPYILDFNLAASTTEGLALTLLLQTGSRGGARPEEVLGLLRKHVFLDWHELYVPAIHREQLFKRRHDKLVPLTCNGGNEVI